MIVNTYPHAGGHAFSKLLRFSPYVRMLARLCWEETYGMQISPQSNFRW